jgi:DNA-3-methyladenine glycosylase
LRLERVLKLPAIEAAPLLLGCVLTRHTPEGLLSVKIVETEAYHQDDPASHSFSGLTKRTAPMFEEGGYIYVYFTYGMHYCMNIVVGKRGVGEAVLLRAAEPLDGIEVMKKHRFGSNVKGRSSHIDLTNGPAKLTQALGIISTELSGKKLGPNTLQLSPLEDIVEADQIIISPRIGIKKALENPWRFYIKNNPFVSRV